MTTRFSLLPGVSHSDSRVQSRRLLLALVSPIALVATGCSSHSASTLRDAATAPDSSGTQYAQDTAVASQAPDSANSAKDSITPDDSANTPEDASHLVDAPIDDARTDTVANAPTDALACTPDEDILRDAINQYTIIPYKDLPDVVTNFLTTFLSVDYINEHFRFFMPNGGAPTTGTPLDFYFVDGCYTSQYGEIQWGVPIYKGEVRYMGPSREWRVLINETYAKALIEAAGCDSSNIEPAWGSAGAPMAGVSEFSGASFYPAWRAGGQSVPPVGLPSGSYCQAATCTVNVETGVLSSTPQSCGVPG
jgi:hypothetical protein